MYKRLSVLVFLSFLAFTSASAQDLNCRSKQENDVIFRNNPKSLKEWNDFNNYSRLQESRLINEMRGVNTTNAATYTLPVVFHVYGDVQSGKTVTYDKLATTLLEINKDFNGLNDDYGTVEPFFQARRATLSIEFKLAKIDPNGNCTTGVIFHPAKNGYGNGGGYDDQIAADAWDNTKYINVYIQNDLYNDGSVTNSGVAWYPDNGMTTAKTARIVFNGAYIFGNTDKEFASTFSHEFGHFLNLIHTFDGGCTGLYQVADTPIEDGTQGLSCTPGTNCTGDKVNIENYMGYNGARGCYKMYTQGQVARMITALGHPARTTLWQPANLTATGVSTSTGSALASTTVRFKEDALNNGALAGNAVIILDGTKTFALATGTLTQGTHYTVTNLPTGLTPVLAVNTNKQLTLTFTGTATSHTASNSGDISVKFLAAAFSGGLTGVRCNGLTFATKFIDPYGIFFVDMADVTVQGAANSWKFFATDFGQDYGAWRFAANQLKIETYGNKLACQTGTKNISLLVSGTIINATSNFTAPTAYPGQLDLRTATYTAWDGKTGYVGFEHLIDGEVCYGWFKVRVDANGDGYTVLEYAYNTQPGANIVAGMTTKIATSLSATTIYEADTNDGAIDPAGVSLKLVTNNGTYTQSSGVVAATKYTLTGVPAGLTATLTAISNNELKLTFAGRATANALSNTANLVLTLKDAIVTGGVAGLDTSVFTIKLDFEDPYGIFSEALTGATANATQTWKYIDLAKGDNTEYGVWRFAANNLKIETYGKRLIGTTGTINITKLPFNSVIDGTKTFIAPGAYPNQLDLRSATYTAWAGGTTGFVGFEYFRRGRPCYGWMQITIDANGDGYTVTKFGYNTKPNGAITTPSSLANATFDNAELLGVYPNPFANEVTISTSEMSGKNVTLSIYNLLGQEVYNKTVTNSADSILLTTNNLDKGVYILKVTVDNEKFISKKIIKK
ncbi:zinc-dependent metalloprotease [Flavobacterium psychrophilum]|uniref:zinc-dependent metalloprotease n=1 Tax=Flavobacterium psychrophilum TaxID=96345 RepID=UPI003984A383